MRAWDMDRCHVWADRHLAPEALEVLAGEVVEELQRQIASPAFRALVSVRYIQGVHHFGPGNLQRQSPKQLATDELEELADALVYRATRRYQRGLEPGAPRPAHLKEPAQIEAVNLEPSGPTGQREGTWSAPGD